MEALVALAILATVAAAAAVWFGSATRGADSTVRSREQASAARELQQLLREVSATSRFTSATPTSFTVETVNATGSASPETRESVTYEARHDGVYRRAGTLAQEKISPATVTFEYYRLDGSPWHPGGNPAEIARVMVRVPHGERERYTATGLALAAGGGQQSSQISRYIPSAPQSTQKEGYYLFDLCPTCGNLAEYRCVIDPGGSGTCDQIFGNGFRLPPWAQWSYVWQGIWQSGGSLGEVQYACKNQQGAWVGPVRDRHPRQYLAGYFLRIVWDYGVANCGWDS